MSELVHVSLGMFFCLLKGQDCLSASPAALGGENASRFVILRMAQFSTLRSRLD